SQIVFVVVGFRFLPAGRALAGLTPYFVLEREQVNEVVSLTAKFVGNHRRLGGKRRNDRDLAALALQRVDQRAEVSVAREDDIVVDDIDKAKRIYRQLDVHVALDLAPAARICEFLGRLRHDLVAVVVQPVDERADRRVLLVLDEGSIIVGAQEVAAALKRCQQSAIIYIKAERSGCGVEIGAINEKSNLLPWIEHIESIRLSPI